MNLDSLLLLRPCQELLRSVQCHCTVVTSRSWFIAYEHSRRRWISSFDCCRQEEKDRLGRAIRSSASRFCKKLTRKEKVLHVRFQRTNPLRQIRVSLVRRICTKILEVLNQFYRKIDFIGIFTKERFALDFIGNLTSTQTDLLCIVLFF